MRVTSAPASSRFLCRVVFPRAKFADSVAIFGPSTFLGEKVVVVLGLRYDESGEKSSYSESCMHQNNPE